MRKQTQFPKKGYSRPNTEDNNSLSHSVYGEEGELFGDFDFSEIQAPRQLVSDLVQSFRKGTGSAGRWRSKSSVKEVASLIRRFAVEIFTANPDLESLVGFNAEMWWEWRDKIKSRTRWPGQINMARCILYEYDDLSPTTRKALAAREKKPKSRLFESYSEREYRRIYAAAWSTVRATRRRIRANLIYLNAFQNGLEPPDVAKLPIKKEPWSRGQLLEYMIQNGRFPGGHMPHDRIEQFRKLLLIDKPGSASQAIFASTAEVFAGIVLLVCERGFNLTVLNGLTANPHNADAETGAVTVQALDKPRRGAGARYFSTSFSGKAGRIWRYVAEMTQPARDHFVLQGNPTDSLLIGRVLGGSSSGGMFKLDWSECQSVAAAWQKASGPTADSGERLTIDFRRLRLTEQVVNQRSNQNSERVSESVYRRPDKQTKEIARGVILQGQLDAVSDAKAIIAVRTITQDEQARAEADPLELANALNISVSRVKQLLHGECDTVVTACTDITHSPFGLDGEVCPASFLRCFGCRNAIATPKHLPRLVLLYDALSELASVVSDAVWATDYKPVFEQLSSLLTNYSTPAEREEARNSSTIIDRNAIKQLLDRRFDA